MNHFQNQIWRILVALVTVFVISQLSFSVEKDNSRDNLLRRIAPQEPAEAVESIEVLPGFRIEQVVAEPLVRDPVAMDFDENGWLFVVEMSDYSEQGEDFLGTIRLLKDTDGDGRFDKSTVYADHLSWPTAVICFDRGIFVGAAPHVFYLKDTDGDDRADLRTTVFTGFSRDNVQGMLNSFRWGLDNRIHGATSTAGGRVTRPNDQHFKPVDLSGRDFSFDPRKFDLRAESGGAQHGMCFDDWGRKFACSNSDHLQQVMFDDRYAVRNPLSAMPSTRLSIAVDGPQAEVFRISPVEEWRIARTRLRIQGVVPGIVEGGGRPAGYFTGATGVTIYRGDAFPAEYRGQVFIGDVGSNLIHRKVLETDGVAMVGKRVDEGREFVASRDIWFRPVQFANAPDGTFYFADMYREVIEHPGSIPPEIKQHLDLTSGRDRGRIYRVVPEGFKQAVLPRLGSDSTTELVKLLEHRNGWHRDTASRLLFERQDHAAIEPLKELVTNSLLPEGRMYALYALEGLGALTPEAVQRGLNDQHPRVREHAVRLSEVLATGSAEIRQRLYTMVSDDDIRVRYQLAFTLGELADRQRLRVLAQLARRDANDAWMCAAILSSLSADGSDVLVDLAADPAFRRSQAGRALLTQLAKQIGARHDPTELRQVESALLSVGTNEPAAAAALVRGLMLGLHRNGRSTVEETAISPQVAAILEQALASSQEIAVDDSQPLATRKDAVQTLALGSFGDLSGTFTKLLEGRQPQELQLATLDSLGHFEDKNVARLLLSAWPQMSPRVRAAASDVMFSRTEWVTALIDALEAANIAVTEIDPARIRQLEAYPDAALRKRAGTLAAKLHLGSRQDVLAAYRSALTMSGNVDRGRGAFRRICAACHRLEDVGYEIGPNLAAVKNRGPEFILLNVLDPNREVNPQFVNYVAVTVDGRTLTGMIASETAANITFRRAENSSDTVPRSDIEHFRSTGQSIMPEGLEKQIDAQEMADLIAYLMAVK